jgi:hypothetical protein
MHTLLLASQWIGEQPSNADYIHKTAGLITDPAHATAEIFYSTIENVIILTVGYMWGKRALKKQHKLLDDEHGFTH